MTQNKFIGMTKNQVINHIDRLYVQFLETFSRPAKVVLVQEVAEAWVTLMSEYEAVTSLISEHMNVYYAYKDSDIVAGEIYRDWIEVRRVVSNIVGKAWNIVRNREYLQAG